MFFSFIPMVALLGAESETSTLSCREWIAIMDQGQEHAHVYQPCVAEAQAGDPQVEYFVGVSNLFSGNEEKALELLSSSAEKGYAASHFALSVIYKKHGNLEKSEHHETLCLSLGTPRQCGK